MWVVFANSGKIQTLESTTGMNYWTGIVWFHFSRSLVQGGVISLKTMKCLTPCKKVFCFKLEGKLRRTYNL